MRMTGLLVLVAACSSSSHDVTMFADASVACAETVEAFCSEHGCDATLDAARQDKSLCPAFLSTCGSFTAIHQMGVDTGLELYYQNGQLVAELLTGVLGHGCAAGPAMFDPPICPTGTLLPDCSP